MNEDSKTEFMKKPKYEPLKMSDKKFSDEYGKKLMQWYKYKEEERKLKQMWDEGETFR